DIIESIEGKSTHEMSLAEIRGILSGEVGSTITVAVVRPRRAEPQKIVITRDVVTIPPVSETMLADNVGYIKVDAFPEGKSEEIAGRIRDLQKQGAKKLVLDLRNSASGAESEGVATANLFLDHGTITYLQGQKYAREAFNADPARDITKLPVAVLVNRGTAGPADTAEDDGGLPDEDQQAAPGEKPSDKKDEKPKNLQDDQLNKALEVLKNRESKG